MQGTFNYGNKFSKVLHVMTLIQEICKGTDFAEFRPRMLNMGNANLDLNQLPIPA
jgi:hypothetical protein